MSELREELRSLAGRVEVPPTTAAEQAWTTARGRVRRRRAAAVGGAAALVVAAAVGLQAITGGPSEVEPAPLPPTGDRLVDVASERVAGERLDPLLGEAVHGWALDRDLVPLADDPLDGPAAYAVGVGRREVQVLGADGRYRSITGLGTTADGSQPLRSGSLSPEATLLALPQPGGLVVVDLLDASTASVDVGGLAVTDVAWVDDDTVALRAGREVRTVDVPADLSEDALQVGTSEVPGSGLPVTGAAGVSWLPEVPGLVVDDEQVPVPSVRREGSAAGPVAVAGEGWLAVAAEPAEESGLPRGVAVLDTPTGRPRAFLPVDALGRPDVGGGRGTGLADHRPPLVAPLAVDGRTTVVLGMQTTYGVLVLRWDWASDELDGLVAEDTGGLPDGTAISWGAGLQGLD